MTEKNELIIDEYVEKRKNGLDFSEIRKELKNLNLTSEEIRIIVREIDNQVINDELYKSKNTLVNEMKYIGLFLMLGGGFVTVASYFGLIDTNGYYVISYGPIIGGYLIYLKSKRGVKKTL